MASTFSNVWGQDDWSKSITESLIRQSALLTAITPMMVDGKVFHKPRLHVHPTAAWTAELATLPTDAGTEDVLAYTPFKIADSTLISRESVEDAPVSVLDALGGAMARGLSHTIDATALAAGAGSSTTPPGLLLGLTANAPAAGASAPIALDDVYNGVSAIEAQGGRADIAFVNAADLNTLRKQKTTTNQYIWLQDNSGSPGIDVGEIAPGVTTIRVAG